MWQRGYDSLPPAGYSMQPGSVPPGFPHYASQGLPGMMMPPHGYMPVPGAPPSSIMRPVMGPMMHQITSMPTQMMSPMPTHSSPAHMPAPIQGQMSESHSQVPGQQSQFSAHQGQIPPPQGQLSGPHIPNMQGQIQGLQGQLQMSSSQIQIPTQATPNQTQSQSEVPRQMIPPPMMAQQSQMTPGAPMSPSSNVPIPHVMLAPMGQQPYHPPSPQQEESTAELISFD